MVVRPNLERSGCINGFLATKSSGVGRGKQWGCMALQYWKAWSSVVTITKWFKSFLVPTPILKLSRKSSRTEPGLAQAWSSMVSMTVLSGIDAFLNNSTNLGGSIFWQNTIQTSVFLCCKFYSHIGPLELLVYRVELIIMYQTNKEKRERNPKKINRKTDILQIDPFQARIAHSLGLN